MCGISKATQFGISGSAWSRTAPAGQKGETATQPSTVSIFAPGSGGSPHWTKLTLHGKKLSCHPKQAQPSLEYALSPLQMAQRSLSKPSHHWSSPLWCGKPSPCYLAGASSCSWRSSGVGLCRHRSWNRTIRRRIVTLVWWGVCIAMGYIDLVRIEVSIIGVVVLGVGA